MTCNTCKIRHLNDQLRSTLSVQHGMVTLTAAVNALPAPTKLKLSAAIMGFKDFDQDNDPHSEHDFGAVEIENETFFFKIDYYDPSLKFGSEDPSDPSKTIRVCTIMHARDY